MNRHQLETCKAAAERYQQHVEHQARLISALNEGRLQPRPSALFEQPRPAKVRKLRRAA